LLFCKAPRPRLLLGQVEGGLGCLLWGLMEPSVYRILIMLMRGVSNTKAGVFICEWCIIPWIIRVAVVLPCSFAFSFRAEFYLVFYGFNFRNNGTTKNSSDYLSRPLIGEDSALIRSGLRSLTAALSYLNTVLNAFNFDRFV